MSNKITIRQYGQLCDIVERAWQHWPTDHDEKNDLNHTSQYARHAAMKIIEVLGLDIESPRRKAKS